MSDIDSTVQEQKLDQITNDCHNDMRNQGSGIQDPEFMRTLVQLLPCIVRAHNQTSVTVCMAFMSSAAVNTSKDSSFLYCTTPLQTGVESSTKLLQLVNAVHCLPLKVACSPSAIITPNRIVSAHRHTLHIGTTSGRSPLKPHLDTTPMTI